MPLLSVLCFLLSLLDLSQRSINAFLYLFLLHFSLCIHLLHFFLMGRGPLPHLAASLLHLLLVQRLHHLHQISHLAMNNGSRVLHIIKAKKLCSGCLYVMYFNNYLTIINFSNHNDPNTNLHSFQVARFT